jgi:hypothetical protein
LAAVVCLLNLEVVLVSGALVSVPLLAGIQETRYKLAPASQSPPDPATRVTGEARHRCRIVAGTGIAESLAGTEAA